MHLEVMKKGKTEVVDRGQGTKTVCTVWVMIHTNLPKDKTDWSAYRWSAYQVTEEEYRQLNIGDLIHITP